MVHPESVSLNSRQEINIEPKEDEYFGEKPKTIPEPQPSEDLYFNYEEKENSRETHFSSHEIVINNSDWENFHRKIKGEFFDQEFDHSNDYTIFGMRRKKAGNKAKLYFFLIIDSDSEI